MRITTACALIALFATSACSHTSPAPTADAPRQLEAPAEQRLFAQSQPAGDASAKIAALICETTSVIDGQQYCGECPNTQAPSQDKHRLFLRLEDRWALAYVEGCAHADMTSYKTSGVFIMKRQADTWSVQRYEPNLSILSCEDRPHADLPALWCDGHLSQAEHTYHASIITPDKDALRVITSPVVHCDTTLACTTLAQGECMAPGRWTSPDLTGDGVADWQWEGEVVRWSGGEQAVAGDACAPLAAPAFTVTRTAELRRWVVEDGKYRPMEQR